MNKIQKTEIRNMRLHNAIRDKFGCLTSNDYGYAKFGGVLGIHGSAVSTVVYRHTRLKPAEKLRLAKILGRNALDLWGKL